MFSEVVERYAELLREISWEQVAFTLTLPDDGVLTVEDAVRRLGFDAAVMHAPREDELEDLELQQVGSGVVTWLNNPYLDGKEVTDPLGGKGFRHWYLAEDIEGNTSMCAHYGDIDGEVAFPEPVGMPFTRWTDHLGPLTPYAEKFAAVYGNWDGEPETWSDNPEVSVLGTCLAVIELESGVRLNGSRHMGGPRILLPMPE